MIVSISPVHSTIHVGQLGEYIQFNEQLRAYDNSAKFRSIPIGFTDFCNTWNDSVASGDSRRISTIYLDDDPQNNYITPASRSVTLQDFHITPAQTGSATDDVNQPSSALQAEIAQEFAALMVAKQRRECQFIEEHRKKKIRAFGTSAPTNTKLIHVRQRTRKRVQHSSPAPTTHSSSPTATHGVEAPPTVLEDQSLISENPDVPADPEDGTIPGESTHVSEAMEINA